MLVIDQIDPAIGNYIAGFVDGEGSFMLKFRPREDFSTGWKVSLAFNVSQKDEVILALLKRHIGCGTMFQKGGGVWMYEVDNLNGLRDHVVPFFPAIRISFRGRRNVTLLHFGKCSRCSSMEIIRLLKASKSCCDLRRDMNDGGKRKVQRGAHPQYSQIKLNPQRLHARRDRVMTGS